MKIIAEKKWHHSNRMPCY